MGIILSGLNLSSCNFSVTPVALANSFYANFLSGTMPSNITYSQAAPYTFFNSSGILDTGGVNPRFDYDPVTLALKGLLIEPTTTNLILDSTAVSNYSQTGAFTPVPTGNLYYGPDNTLSATRLQLASYGAGVGQPTALVLNPVSTFPVNSGMMLTFSLYVAKSPIGKDAKRYAYLNIGYRASGRGGPTGYHTTKFDLQTGLITDTADYSNGSYHTFVSAGSIAANNSTVTANLNNGGYGWRRYFITIYIKPYAGTFILYPRVGCSGADQPSFWNLQTGTYLGYEQSTSAGTEEIAIYGGQLETSAYPTSIILTTGTSLSRGFGSITTPDLSWYNYSVGTAVCAFDTEIASSYQGQQDIFSIGTTSTYGQSASIVGTAAYATFDTNTTTALGSVTTNTTQIIAATYDQITNAGVLGTGSVIYAATQAAIAPPTSLLIGGALSTSTLNGHIKTFSYYSGRGYDSQVQALTSTTPPTPRLAIDFTTGTIVPSLWTETGNGGGQQSSIFNSLGQIVYNVSRITYDPSTGRCLGYLFEPASTNYISDTGFYQLIGNPWKLYNSVNDTWGNGSITGMDGNTVTPTGLYYLNGTGNSGRHGGYILSSAGSTNTTYCFSIYIATDNVSDPNFYMSINDSSSNYNTVVFNLRTQAIVTATSAGSIFTRISYGTQAVNSTTTTAQLNTDFGTTTFTGWYRYWIVSQTTSTGVAPSVWVSFGPAGSSSPTYNNGIPTYTSNGENFCAYGPQLEKFAFPTSYIYNTNINTIAVRSVFSLQSKNFSNVYNKNAGTFVASFTPLDTSSTTKQNVFNLNNSTTGVGAYISTGTNTVYVAFENTNTAIIGTVSAGTKTKLGLAYDGLTNVAVLNGNVMINPASQTAVNTSGVAFIWFNGTLGANRGQYYGYINSFSYYDSRLPDVVLQALTT